jgi:hypothetical protein
MGDGEPSVTITLREIYDLMVTLRDDVRALTQTNTEVTRVLEDHEQRLRGVERWRIRIPVVLLTSLVTSVVAAVMSIAKTM